jgi:S1-C subfamily serine protease
MMAMSESGCSAIGIASFSRSAALRFAGAEGGGVAFSWPELVWHQRLHTLMSRMAEGRVKHAFIGVVYRRVEEK